MELNRIVTGIYELEKRAKSLEQFFLRGSLFFIFLGAGVYVFGLTMIK